MSDLADKALLPAGLRDVLPPDAAHEAEVVARLMSALAARGYEWVKPPLIEFEESLLAGAGAAMAPQTFRLMDPVSHRMLALRPDMTMQIARIAATRLGNAPRPLRLAYAGQVLRVKGSQIQPERQLGQVGAELIGSAAARADAEVIVTAAETMATLGVTGLSVDLGLPTLVPAVCAELGIAGEPMATLRAAFDRKDAAEVAAVAGRHGTDAAGILEALLAAAGPAERALAVLGCLALGPRAAAERQVLVEVAGLVRKGAPGFAVTIDPVENRGFEYHTGVTFAFFAPAVRGELGRGGRYIADAGGLKVPGEPATGFTLFMDALLGALPAPRPARRLFVTAGTPADRVAMLRAGGWVTIQSLDEADDPATEARRLGCSHLWDGRNARPVDEPAGRI